MKKKLNIQDIDFEKYLDNALKSHGYLFPETDEQMAVFEESLAYLPVPEELDSPELVFKTKGERKSYREIVPPVVKSEDERNWAIAAREGKDIPPEIVEQMKKDRDEARAKQDGDKKK